MRSFDQRFATRAKSTETLEALRALPTGSTVRLRSVLFIKLGRSSWANDFREQLTDLDVASCCDGTETITPKETT